MVKQPSVGPGTASHHHDPCCELRVAGFSTYFQHPAGGQRPTTGCGRDTEFMRLKRPFFPTWRDCDPANFVRVDPADRPDVNVAVKVSGSIIPPRRDANRGWNLSQRGSRLGFCPVSTSVIMFDLNVANPQQCGARWCSHGEKEVVVVVLVDELSWIIAFITVHTAVSRRSPSTQRLRKSPITNSPCS